MARVRSFPNQARVLKAIRDGAESGLREITVSLGNLVRLYLSHRGTGRVYAKTMYGRKNARRLGLRVGRYGEVFVRRATTIRGQMVTPENVVRAFAAGRKRQPGNFRSVGFHVASYPGMPPAVDTGTLRNSWQAGFNSPAVAPYGTSAIRMRVGSGVKYAAFLERGTRRMRPRPYLRPVVDGFRDRAGPIVERAVDASLTRLGLSRRTIK
jgi:hypothetical protein